MSLPAAELPPLFAPPGMWTNDNWFATSGGVYHAFYLQVPTCMGDPNDWGKRALLAQVGHATSRDLWHWTDCGPVVVPIPGTWCSSLATGSVAAYAGKWWMVFTAHGRPSGIGLAVSDDLMAWRLVGDGPVVLSQEFEAAWQGTALRWRPLADPYLYPEPVDGWFYMIINAQVLGVPTSASGCLATVRSRDLLAWEPGPVLAYPQSIERLETPQLWTRNGHWYLYFGAAHDQPEIAATWRAEVPAEIKDRRRVNCLYTAATFAGPYAPAPGTWWLDRLPDGRGGYIHKVLPGSDGTDVLITTTDARLSHPYPVSYGPDGALSLSLPRAAPLGKP